MSTETTITATEVVAQSPSKEAQADMIMRRYVLWSMGGGLIPVVGLDIVAIIAAQIKMLCEMSKVYGVEFRENRVKSIVTTLIGGLGIVPLGTGILFSAIKVIPVFGALAATVALPISAGAITYATGKIFITHFESGGSFLTFDANTMKEAYRKMFEEGKKFAQATKSSPKAAEAAK